MPDIKRPRLTAKQRRVLDALHHFIDLYDRVPTHHELGDHLQLARTTITIHLRTLEEKGYLRRTRKWRDVEFLCEDEGGDVARGNGWRSGAFTPMAE